MEGRRTRSGLVQTAVPARSKKSLALGKATNSRNNSINSVEEENSATTIEVTAEIHAEDLPVSDKDTINKMELNDEIQSNGNIEEKPPDNSVESIGQNSVITSSTNQIDQDEITEGDEKLSAECNEMTEVEVMVPADENTESVGVSSEQAQDATPDVPERMDTDTPVDIIDGDSNAELASNVLKASQDAGDGSEHQPVAVPEEFVREGLSKDDSTESDKRLRYGKVQEIKKQDIYELCHLCGKGFLNIVQLQSHMKAEHNNVVQYQCMLCHMVYLDKEKATNHSKIEHSDSDGIYIRPTNETPAYKKSTETYISARPKKRGTEDVEEEFFPYTLEKNEVPVKVEMENKPKRKRLDVGETENANNNHKSMFGTNLIPSPSQSETTKPYRFVGKTYESKKKAGQTLVISPAHVIQGKRTSTRIYSDKIHKSDSNSVEMKDEGARTEQEQDSNVKTEEQQPVTENSTDVSNEQTKVEQDTSEQTTEEPVQQAEDLKDEEKENTATNATQPTNVDTSTNDSQKEKPSVDKNAVVNNDLDVGELEPGQELFPASTLSDSDGEDKVPGFSSKSTNHIIWKFALKCAGRRSSKLEIKCRLCETICPTKDSFYSHVALNHKTLIPWKCEYCEYQTRWVTSLRVHLRKKHPECNFEKCECGEKFPTKDKLKEHLKEHTPITCTPCKIKFHTPAAYQTHYKETHIHANVKYSCPACHQTYSSKLECVKHIQDSHLPSSNKQQQQPSTPPPPAQYSCPVCGEKCANQPLLTQHMKEHGLLRYCGTCKKNFSTDEAFKTHMEYHNKKASLEFKCATCGASCTSAAQLASHIEEAHKKIYTCVKCKKKFKNKQEFQTHISTKHQEDIMFRCSLCPNILFRALSTAKQHYEEKHGKNKTKEASTPVPAASQASPAPSRTLYRCAECHQCFQTAEACIKHQRVHADTSLPHVSASDINNQALLTAAAQSTSSSQLQTSVASLILSSTESPLRQALMAPKFTAAATTTPTLFPPMRSRKPLMSKTPGPRSMVQIFMCERCHKYFPNANSLALHVLQEHSSVSQPQPPTPAPAPARSKSSSRVPAILSRSSSTQQQQQQQVQQQIQQPASQQQQYYIDAQGNLVPVQQTKSGSYVLYDGQQNLVLQTSDATNTGEYGQVLVTDQNTVDQNQTWVVNQDELGQYLLADNQRTEQQQQEVEWVVESIDDPSSTSALTEQYYTTAAASTAAEYYTSGGEYYSTAQVSGTEYYTDTTATVSTAEYYNVENPQVSHEQYTALKEEAHELAGQQAVKVEGESFISPKTEPCEELGFKIDSVVGQSEGMTDDTTGQETVAMPTEGAMTEHYEAAQTEGIENTAQSDQNLLAAQAEYGTALQDGSAAQDGSLISSQAITSQPSENGQFAPVAQAEAAGGQEGEFDAPQGEQVQQLLEDAITAQGLQDLVQVNVTPKPSESNVATDGQLPSVSDGQIPSVTDGQLPTVTAEGDFTPMPAAPDSSENQPTQEAVAGSSAAVANAPGGGSGSENLSVELRNLASSSASYTALSQSMLDATQMQHPGEQLLEDLQQQHTTQAESADSSQDFLNTSQSLQTPTDFQAAAQDVMAQFQQQASQIQSEFQDEAMISVSGDTQGAEQQPVGEGAGQAEIHMEDVTEAFQAQQQQQEQFDQGAQVEQAFDQGGQVEQAFDQGGQVEQAFEQGAQVEQAFDQGGQVEQAFDQGGQVEQAFDQGGQVEQAFDQGGQVEQAFDQGGQVEQGIDQGAQVEQAFDQGGQVEQAFDQGGQVEQAFDHGAQVEQAFDQGGQVEQAFDQGQVDHDQSSQIKSELAQEGQLEGFDQVGKLEPGLEQGLQALQDQLYQAGTSEQEWVPEQQEAGTGGEEQVVMQVEVPVGHTLVQFDGNIDPAILQHAVSQINGPNGELYLVIPENIIAS